MPDEVNKNSELTDSRPSVNTNEGLFEAAKDVLTLNDKGTHTVPAKGLYPHQWLWDSCFIAIGIAHYDVTRAQSEILSLFRGQWSNGMLPSIILRNKRDKDGPAYDRHERIWRSWLNPNSPDDVDTSGITQPPMIAEAIIKIGEQLSKADRKVWYKKVYPGLVRYHEWLYNERDPHDEGLVLLVHPWEAGLDNTPPWMKFMSDHLLPWWIRVFRKTRLDEVVGWFRSDSKMVLKDQRLTNVEALALFSVQRRLRRKNYDFDRLINHSLFAIEDLTFNSIFIRANHHLQDISKELKKPLPDSLVKKMDKSDKKINDLWDEYAQEYFSRDFVSHRLLTESSIASFMPLYSGVISKERAARIVESLENEHRYGMHYPVPSVPMDSPWFQANRYWQGPTWVNTNWLVIEGLKKYGYDDHAEALRESTIEMVRRGGFHEYFNPIEGSGIGSASFSWTAALIIDLIKNI